MKQYKFLLSLDTCNKYTRNSRNWYSFLHIWWACSLHLHDEKLRTAPASSPNKWLKIILFSTSFYGESFYSTSFYGTVQVYTDRRYFEQVSTVINKFLRSVETFDKFLRSGRNCTEIYMQVYTDRRYLVQEYTKKYKFVQSVDTWSKYTKQLKYVLFFIHLVSLQR